jgi:TRAP-type C4-dicarboxylate transport system substrate-binding protein
MKAQGCEIVELNADQHKLFADRVQPIYAEARKQIGNELFELMKR